MVFSGFVVKDFVILVRWCWECVVDSEFIVLREEVDIGLIVVKFCIWLDDFLLEFENVSCVLVCIILFMDEVEFV